METLDDKIEFFLFILDSPVVWVESFEIKVQFKTCIIDVSSLEWFSYVSSGLRRVKSANDRGAVHWNICQGHRGRASTDGRRKHTCATVVYEWVSKIVHG